LKVVKRVLFKTEEITHTLALALALVWTFGYQYNYGLLLLQASCCLASCCQLHIECQTHVMA